MLNADLKGCVLLVCSLFEERGVSWKGASCQGRGSHLEKDLLLWKESMLAKYNQAKISLLYSPMSRLHECYPELDLLSLKLILVLGVMRWVTLSDPFLPTPRLPPDFIVATGPSCIFLPGCKIQEMFVSWGEIECMEEICRPQYRYKFRSCSLYEGLKQIV